MGKCRPPPDPDPIHVIGFAEAPGAWLQLPDNVAMTL